MNVRLSARVLEQLDPLALWRHRRSHAREIRETSHRQPGRFDSGERLHTKRYVIDNRSLGTAGGLALGEHDDNIGKFHHGEGAVAADEDVPPSATQKRLFASMSFTT